MNKSAYFRPPDYGYLLRSHPGYGFVVGSNSESRGAFRLVLAGVVGSQIVRILFGNEGKLVEGAALPDDGSSRRFRRYGGDEDAFLDAVLEPFGVVPGTFTSDDEIEIRRFYLRDVGVGVVDWGPLSPRDDDTRSRYERDHVYSFLWGNDFLMEGGKVICS